MCLVKIIKYTVLISHSLCRSCYMVFPSLQVALALSCVMGLVMFARYCGEDHSDKRGTSTMDAVSFSVLFTPICTILRVNRDVIILFFSPTFLLP